MSRLNLHVTYNLGGVADGWTEDHYLRFRTFDAAKSAACRAELDAAGQDDQKATATTVRFLEDQFVDGKVLVDGETVEADPGDIGDLPSAILLQLLELVSRSRFADPKVGMN